MSAYMIFNYKILDRSKVDELMQLVMPVMQKYQAELLVGSPVKVLEGITLPHMVIYKFESFDVAEQCYYSEEYQKVTAFRNKITEGFATLVPDVSETDKLVQLGYFANQ